MSFACWDGSSPSPVPFEQLRPGVRYQIVIDDCARQGASGGALTPRLLAPNAGREDDYGVLLTGWVGRTQYVGPGERGGSASTRERCPCTPLRRDTTVFLPRSSSATRNRPFAQYWKKGTGDEGPVAATPHRLPPSTYGYRRG